MLKDGEKQDGLLTEKDILKKSFSTFGKNMRGHAPEGCDCAPVTDALIRTCSEGARPENMDGSFGRHSFMLQLHKHFLSLTLEYCLFSSFFCERKLMFTLEHSLCRICKYRFFWS